MQELELIKFFGYIRNILTETLRKCLVEELRDMIVRVHSKGRFPLKIQHKLTQIAIWSICADNR